MTSVRLREAIGKKARYGARMLRARLPERMRVRFLPGPLRYSPRDVPAPVEAPSGTVRLLIGPANFAGQGRAWARAAERLPGVGAVNLQYRSAEGFAFAADYELPEGVWAHSDSWRRAQREQVARSFSHVLFEAEKSPLGFAGDQGVVADAAFLHARGVTVGMACHGTDIRRPSSHAERDEYSPFRNADPEWLRILESRARANLRILDHIGAPVFVSTPDMLLDRPGATWLPVVVDPARWASADDALTRDRPVVVHAPTQPLFKGTALIEPVVSAMHDRGDIVYRRVVRVPPDEMPAVYRDADIVLEQFALGMYSVASVEAMAAGRLAVAHVHRQVRDHVRQVTGRELPVVDATPATLPAVLQDIRSRPDHYRSIAAQGPDFVRAVHDGGFSARVLAPFLGVDAGATS